MKKRFRITLNDNTYEVVAEILDDEAGTSSASVTAAPPRPSRASGAAAVAAPPAPRPAPVATGGGAVPSPLAGKVVSIDVPVGAQVEAGQQVLTLEAMKMNTIVSANSAGTVKQVHVTAGDSVEEGQALLTIE